jgi:HSP20 family molecular chaperone IbpA
MSTKSTVQIQRVESLNERRREFEDRIRIRAYERFLQRGGAPGREYDDWVGACADIAKQPPVTIAETESQFVVLFHVPDVNVKELELVVSDRAIVLQSLPHPMANIPGVIHVREFCPPQVMRFVQLPRVFNPEAIAVDYADGILRVSLALPVAVAPKPAAKPPRTKPKTKAATAISPSTRAQSKESEKKGRG